MNFLGRGSSWVLTHAPACTPVRAAGRSRREGAVRACVRGGIDGRRGCLGPLRMLGPVTLVIGTYVGSGLVPQWPPTYNVTHIRSCLLVPICHQHLYS